MQAWPATGAGWRTAYVVGKMPMACLACPGQGGMAAQKSDFTIHCHVPGSHRNSAAPCPVWAKEQDAAALPYALAFILASPRPKPGSSFTGVLRDFGFPKGRDNPLWERRWGRHGRVGRRRKTPGFSFLSPPGAAPGTAAANPGFGAPGGEDLPSARPGWLWRPDFDGAEGRRLFEFSLDALGQSG